MTIRTNVKVYRVPFTMTATGAIFVIADSVEDAARTAANFDLGDFIHNDGETINIESTVGMFFDDGDIVIENKDLSKIAVQDDYDVSDHPDYDPYEHDEENVGDPEDEGAQALARSHSEGGGL